MHLHATTPEADYINASLITDLLPSVPAMIFAQGPLEATVADFWRMVFQQRSRCIVMVTNLVEMGKIKCELYWPEDTDARLVVPESPCGSALTVTLCSVKMGADWIEREFAITDDHTPPLRVTQFHFTAWPDRGVPDPPNKVLDFVRAVQMTQRQVNKYRLLLWQSFCKSLSSSAFLPSSSPSSPITFSPFLFLSFTYSTFFFHRPRSAGRRPASPSTPSLCTAARASAARAPSACSMPC